MLVHKIMFLEPGDTLDEFNVLEIIGGGGFSVIYKAEDTALDRLVAIKQLNPAAFADPDTEKHFMREAKLAASLNHPHIVPIYGLRRRDDALFLIMEYLDGGSVRDLLAKYGGLSLEVSLKLTAHVCTALDILHQRGVIHRDIKPENILRTAQGDFKLVDFGLAHVMHIDRQRTIDHTSAGPQSGTLLYMSPEQAAGQPLTIQSDIYSFAAVLYEALTGAYYLPLDKSIDDEQGVVKQIKAVVPFPPSKANPRLSTAFDQPLLRALSKKTSDRFASAGEFLVAIERATAEAVQAQAKSKDHASHTDLPDITEELYTIRTLRDLLAEPQEALTRLNGLPVGTTNVPAILAERGETLIALGDTHGYTLIEQAIASGVALPFAQMALAEHYLQEEDEEAYSIAMIDAIEADADLVFAVHYTRIVEAIQQPSDYWRYVNLFKAARPSAAVNFNLGRILALVKGYEADAIAALNAAIMQAPEAGPVYVALGNTFLSLNNGVNNTAQAFTYFVHAARSEFPTYPEGEWHKSPSAYRVTHAYLGLALSGAAIDPETEYGVDALTESVHAARVLLESEPEEMADHCAALLRSYQAAATIWLEADRVQEAYDLLDRALPLAQMCSGSPETSSQTTIRADPTFLLLLGTAQAQLGMEQRENADFESAAAWLESAIQMFQAALRGANPTLTTQLSRRLDSTRRDLRLARQHR